MPHFEVHLTVPIDADLDALALATGMKPLRIELSRGAHPVQPMLSERITGSLESGHALLRARVRALLRAGATVVRAKLEQQADALADAPTLEAGEYFEQHLKLRTDDWVAVRALCATHDAHLSQNAVSDGRFVTQRSRDRWADTRARFDALDRALRAAGITVVRREQEWVRLDTREQLDAGWLE